MLLLKLAFIIITRWHDPNSRLLVHNIFDGLNEPFRVDSHFRGKGRAVLLIDPKNLNRQERNTTTLNVPPVPIVWGPDPEMQSIIETFEKITGNDGQVVAYYAITL